MSLRLPQLSFSIICEGNELEMFDVKQEGPSLVRAFVASEAGKQFAVTFTNGLVDCALGVELHIDGELVRRTYLAAQQYNGILGIYKDPTSILPFKFQELELVDPDVEDAPVVPDMGTIELRAFRLRAMGTINYRLHAQYGLHRGRVSERSKKAGWHHVSTDDEMPFNTPPGAVFAEFIDRKNAPCATFKVFYRPRALLMAQGVIAREYVPARTSERPRINGRKRTGEDALPGPSKRRARSTVKNEDLSATARAQRIRDLQAELNSLTDGRPSSSVKLESRPPFPIVVGKAAGEVIDLTLED